MLSKSASSKTSFGISVKPRPTKRRFFHSVPRNRRNSSATRECKSSAVIGFFLGIVSPRLSVGGSALGRARRGFIRVQNRDSCLIPMVVDENEIVPELEMQIGTRIGGVSQAEVGVNSANGEIHPR